MSRPESTWLTCTTCGRTQLIASGFCGTALNADLDRLHAAASQLNWEPDPMTCSTCLGRPEILSGEDFRNARKVRPVRVAG